MIYPRGQGGGRLRRMLGYGRQGSAASVVPGGAGGPAAPAGPSVSGAPSVGAPDPLVASSAAVLQPNTGYTNALGRRNGGALRPRQIQRRLSRLTYENAQRAQGPLWDSINHMLDYANPENRAAALAPEMEAIDRFELQAQGQSLANMLGRGIDESSYAGAVEGAISAGANDRRADAIRSRIDTEQQANRANMAALAALQSGNVDQAARIVQSMIEADLMRQQMAAAQQFDWGAMLGDVLGAAGRVYAGKGKF